MKISIKGFITSKKSEHYSDCADNYAVSFENHKFSVSDGVSRSFYPNIWSECLVKNFVSKKEGYFDTFIQKSQEEWQTKIDEIIANTEVKWFTKAQYNRKSPALATFVGLEFLEDDGLWTAQALGDSFLFFAPKGITNFKEEILSLSSKPTPIQFDNFPDYVSSIGDKHKGEKKLLEKENLVEGTFYLMTDALAEWFLHGVQPEEAIQKINAIQSQEQFINTIDVERTLRKLNDDDSAILIIELENDGLNKFTYSKHNISDLSEMSKMEESIPEEKKGDKNENLVELENQEILVNQIVTNEDESLNQSIRELNNLEALVSLNKKNENIPRITTQEVVPEENKFEISKEETDDNIPNVISVKESPKAKSVTDKF